MLCVITTIRLLLLVDEPNDKGLKFKQVHNVDRPHKGSKLQSTTWTDPTRVKKLNKSTKWTNPTKGQDLNPQSGRTHQIDNNQVHKVDGPHEGSRLQSTKWTDRTKGQDLNP